MFSSNRNIEALCQLFSEGKDYVELKLRFLQLDLVGKMTILLSTLVLGAILFLIVAMVILLLSFMAIELISPKVGTVGAYGITAAAYVVLACIIYVFRKKLLINPMANFLGKLLLKNNKKNV